MWNIAYEIFVCLEKVGIIFPPCVRCRDIAKWAAHKALRPPTFFPPEDSIATTVTIIWNHCACFRIIFLFFSEKGNILLFFLLSR